MPQLEFEQLPFRHPLFIVFSSGTTGAPKCMVHSAGVGLSARPVPGCRPGSGVEPAVERRVSGAAVEPAPRGGDMAPGMCAGQLGSVLVTPCRSHFSCPRPLPPPRRVSHPSGGLTLYQLSAPRLLSCGV